MSTPYRPVSWGNEYISSDKLNVMTANDQYFFENLPSVYYHAHGLHKKSGGMKIMAGKAVVSPDRKNNNAHRTYHFGGFFSQGCQPVIATSLSLETHGRYHVIVSGFGGMSPDHRGVDFRVMANALTRKNNVIKTTVYVNWIAVGY